MRSTLDELGTELSDLRSLVGSILPVNTALAGHHDSVIRHYLLIRRRFDYATFIVAIYASVEKFLENLVAAYAQLVTKRVQYSELPPKLVQKHMTKSAEMLARGRLGEGRYIGIREVDVVKNLYDCLTNATPYSLNQMAVIAHDLNLRHAEINALFSTVGIEQVCDLTRRTDAMLQWYIASHGLAEPPRSGVPSASVEQRINDIVERRNQVAHRGGNPDDLLGPDEMADTITFIDALSKAIFSVVVAKYLQDRYVASGGAPALPIREGPFQNGQVVVVDRPDQPLFVGQPVFVVGVSSALWGRILSLQIDGEQVETVDREIATSRVGIKLDFKCPKNAVLYALAADDDLIWPGRFS